MAYYIVLEREIEGLDPGMDGKSLGRHMETLDAAALQQGVRPLSEFFSLGPEAADFLESEGMGDIELPPVEHYAATDGLATVRALLASSITHPGHVAEDLRQCERILTVAAQHGVGWHFAVDN